MEIVFGSFSVQFSKMVWINRTPPLRARQHADLPRLAAATHDVAIQVDVKKFRIVHRIDPVDAERDFIAGNLAETRLVTYQEYLLCVDPVFKGKTATGGSYYSDSRMLLVDLDQVKSDNLDLKLDTSDLRGSTGPAAVRN